METVTAFYIIWWVIRKKGPRIYKEIISLKKKNDELSERKRDTDRNDRGGVE